MLFTLNIFYFTSEGGLLHSKTTMTLLYFICKDRRPFHIVQGAGFKRLMKELVPSYKVPCPATLKKVLDDKYEITKISFIKTLEDVQHMSLTFDVWTETMTETSFLGVTMHFLENTVLKSQCLAVRELKEKHTAEYIECILNNILLNWNINKEKIVTIITDNGANMIASVNNVLGKNKHTPCFAHTINLVSESVVKHQSIEPLITKVRNVVLWIKKSVNISDTLRKVQIESGVPEGCVQKMVLDVKTRWNSTFYMLQRFIEMVNIISPITLQHITAPAMPTAIEINTIKQFIELLKPLEFVTRESSGDKYVTISKIIPMINCLMSQVSLLKPSEDIIHDVHNKLNLELVKRFGKTQYVTQIAISTLLDPRFKNLHFSDPNACSRAMSALRNLMRTEMSSSESEGETSVEVAYDFWATHKELVHNQGNKKKKSNPVYASDELSLYLANPVTYLSFDPLEQWEDMKNVFPLLYKQARIHFSIVATSVPCERLFSKAGATMNQARNRLTSSRMEKLLFMADFTEQEWFT